MISPSMIKAWLACPRKFAWDYIDLIPRKHTPATEFGERVHGEIEHYLSGGDLSTDEAGKLAAHGLAFLPQPKTPGMKLEHRFLFQYERIFFTGQKDVDLETTDVLAVYDHKTTSDFKWAKSEDELRTDPQVVIYSADSMLRAGRPTCEIQWTYFKKRGRREVKPIRFTVSRGEIFRNLLPLVDVAKEIITCGSKCTTARDLPYNPNECSAYGGCQYQSLCNLSVQEQIKAIMSDGQNNFLAGIQAQLAALQAQPASNPAPAAQAPPQAVFGPPPTQPQQTPPAAPAPAVASFASLFGQAPTTPAAPAPAPAVPTSFNPLAPPPTSPAPNPPPLPLVPGAMPSFNPSAPSSPSPFDLDDDDSDDSDDSPPEPQKKRRGRRPKAEVAKEKGFRLYVDCLPLHEKTVSAVDAVSKANVLVSQHAGVPHWSMIEYGKGRGVFLSAVKHILENETPTESVFLSTASTDEREALTVFTEKARTIVRGLR